RRATSVVTRRVRAGEDGREGLVCDRRPLVAQLEQLGETVLLKPIELVRGEGGMQGDIRKKRQSAIQLRGRRVQREGVRFPAAEREKADPQIRSLVSNVQTLSGGGPLSEHRGRQIRRSCLACRIRGTTAANQ